MKITLDKKSNPTKSDELNFSTLSSNASLDSALLNKSNYGIELSAATDIPQVKLQRGSKQFVFLTMRKSKLRFLALAMAALLLFGNNYSFDNPQALQKPIMEDVGLSSTQYNLLYTAFSFPNIFLTLAGGFMIDFLGVRVGIFIFCLTVLVAQSVVAIGGTYKIFWIMLVGRSCFGVASENLIISQSAIVGKWFRGRELSTAIGIITTVPELASALNSFVSPLIYDKTGNISYPLFVSVIICIFSLFCALVLIILDKRADKEEQGIDAQEDGEDEGEEKVSFKDIKEFSPTFWILIMICVLTLGVYIPFLDDANDFYQDKFKFTSVEAGQVLMIPYLVSALTSPFIGTYVDRVGRRRLFIVITCGLFMISCFLFAVLPAGSEEQDENNQKILHPYWFSLFPLFLLGISLNKQQGISFSAYSCVIIPSVQYVVKQRVMGTAFGLMGMFESIALASFPLFAASIVTSAKDTETGYSNVGYFYTGMSFIGLMLSFTLYYFDKKVSLILDFVNPEEPTVEEKQILRRYRRPSQESQTLSESDNLDQTSQGSNEIKPRITEQQTY